MAHGPLRNGTTDINKLAQWLGRKVRNHNPMKAHVGTPAKKGVKSAKVRVGIEHQTEGTVVYALPNGRRFRIKIEEVDAAEAPIGITEVGY